jgi:hypothetical protein
MFATYNIRGPPPSPPRHNTQHHKVAISKTIVYNIKNIFKIVATSATFENK